MHINKQLIAWAFGVACVHSASAQTPPMVTKHLYDFATPGGGGYPNDDINDHQAFVDAAAYFQARNGYGTLILEDGEYIMGVQQFRNPNDPQPGLDWDIWRYPLGDPSAPFCYSMVASQNGFVLDNCFNFTIQGGANTRVRYRDCLYYGTFVRDVQTGAVSSAVAAQDTTLWVQTITGQDTIIAPVTLSNCITCDEQWHLPAFLDLNLRHAAVGTMFTFRHCDSIAVRNVELNGNIDQANLGGKIDADGMQTAHDGIIIWESSRCLVEYVHAHHFGRDGIMVMSDYQADSTIAYASLHPGLSLTEDTADVQVEQWNRTLLFDNQIKNSQFNWNGRQGLSWTGCSQLTVTSSEFNYNGSGRISSLPGSGLDIEGGGGPMRVRYGVFNDCRFLHNSGHGIVSTSGPCYGQQHFTFNNCTIKAG